MNVARALRKTLCAAAGGSIALMAVAAAAAVADVACTDPVLYARHQHHRLLLIEGAGLFWILAELIILFACMSARQRLAARPLRLTLTPTPAEIRRAVRWVAAFVVLTVVVMGRHLIWPPAYTILNGVSSDATIQEMWISRAHTHLAIWSFFVVIWVTLEIAIVYQGWRAYAQLRAILNDMPSLASGRNLA